MDCQSSWLSSGLRFFFPPKSLLVRIILKIGNSWCQLVITYDKLNKDSILLTLSKLGKREGKTTTNCTVKNDHSVC